MIVQTDNKIFDTNHYFLIETHGEGVSNSDTVVGTTTTGLRLCLYDPMAGELTAVAFLKYMGILQHQNRTHVTYGDIFTEYMKDMKVQELERILAEARENRQL